MKEKEVEGRAREGKKRGKGREKGNRTTTCEGAPKHCEQCENSAIT